MPDTFAIWPLPYRASNDTVRPPLQWLAASGFVITLGAAVALTFVSPPEEAGG